MDKEYDIILYGASSYTAGYIIPYLENYDLKIGLASRNISNLESSNLPKIQCELTEAPSQTNILINCAGPYHLIGEEIIKSCIRNKTHYIDLCGEVHFIKYIYNKYHNEALKEGLFIIQACGFDSLIADLGNEIIKNKFDKDVEVRSVLELENPILNFGTWESLINSISRYTKNTIISEVRGNVKCPSYYYDENIKSYVVKFRGSDHFVVTSTQKLLRECNIKTCKYEAYLKTGNIFLYFLYFALISLMCKFNFGKNLLLRFYKFFSYNLVEKSPSREIVKRGSFTLSFEGVGMKNLDYKTKHLVISGPDVYTTTGICISQASLVLHEMIKSRQDGKNISNLPGGVVTPGFVFRETNLKEKLRNLGIIFNIKE
ncbi:saccharopine dehydrogenase (SCCPDH) [Vairimorpha necatrix]|uniref:Saccharopine dehydrogenase (SCCPDH) n=1 Tax=Vairimorpha necatrix TaxID=6039 RepID=A0AAX4J9S0_9MICR